MKELRILVAFALCAAPAMVTLAGAQNPGKVDVRGTTLETVRVLPESGSGITIEITTKDETAPWVETLDDPPRIVVDFPNTVLAIGLGPIPIRSNGVKGIRIGTDAEKTTRVVVDLERLCRYEFLSGSGHRLILTLDPTSTAPVPAAEGGVSALFRRKGSAPINRDRITPEQKPQQGPAQAETARSAAGQTPRQDQPPANAGVQASTAVVRTQPSSTAAPGQRNIAQPTAASSPVPVTSARGAGQGAAPNVAQVSPQPEKPTSNATARSQSSAIGASAPQPRVTASVSSGPSTSSPAAARLTASAATPAQAAATATTGRVGQAATPSPGPQTADRASPSTVPGQTPTAALSGRVSDQTGAVIPQASVSLTGPNGATSTTTTDAQGDFHFPSLPPGSYGLAARAQGFAPYSKEGVVLVPGRRQTLNVNLNIQTQEEKVEVHGEEGQPHLDVSSSSNASSVVLTGKDLEALSDDPDELLAELQALAGPSAGPSGGQIFIDGFTGGQLPPKSSIREIRINRNPFSAQYDRLGYGRIEVFTKPGTDKLHGQFFFNDTNAVLNSRNPYVFAPKPAYNTDTFEGNLGGPLSKKASFFVNASRSNINEFAAIHVTDPDLGPGTFTESIPNPRIHSGMSPRFDYQLSGSNTLTARYQLTHESSQNSGLGRFSLPSLAYDLNQTEHTLQISDTQILSPRMMNETRFQFQRETSHQLPLSALTQVQVQGAFTGGGSNQGQVRNTQNNYELQDYVTISHGKHLTQFGTRLRGLTIASRLNPNFNGTFVFSNVYSGGQLVATGLQAYQNAIAGNCSSTNYSPIACPSQFSMSAGNPAIQLNWFDAGLYAEDEWRVRPHLSFNYGLRFESQNHIHDRADFGPRLGLAWGLGSGNKSAPKTVLRAGFGIFYDRFGWNLFEQADRLNGFNQQAVVVDNPNFYNSIPSFAQLQTLPTAAPTVYRISPDLRSPYIIQAAGSIERQVTKAATVSVTYLNSRGEHAFYTRNINAPTFAGGPRPNPNGGNIYEYESGGIFRQNQLIANGRVAVGSRISLSGYYSLNYANSNASAGGGPSGGGGGGGGGGGFSSGTTSSAPFLSNQYDPMADYGRAPFDVRHRAFVGGSIEVPHVFRLSPFVMINSGRPFNITTGQDNNGDSIFNDRPILQSQTTCSQVQVSGSLYCTPLGTFNTAISATTPLNSIVPVNYGTGPVNATFNIRISKTFGFGPEGGKARGGRMKGGGRLTKQAAGGGGPEGDLGTSGFGGTAVTGAIFGNGTTNRRYNLTFSIFGRNLFNTVNPGLPVGNLSSPFFGQSISIAGRPFSSATANRRIDTEAQFSF